MYELANFIEALGAADTPATMEAAFSHALERLGVSHFTYHIVHASGSPERLPYVISTYPKPWAEHYFSEGYLDDDPVVTGVLNRRLPFRWSLVTQPEDLNPRQRRMMAEAWDVGLRNGVTIPLSGHGVGVAAASIIAPGDGGDPEAFFDQHQHLLHLMAIYFHHRAGSALLQSSMIAPSSRRRSVLTEREREVLEWIARGKSAWEIASILGISEKSVEFHVEGAKRKLQVFNRTHAVAKALMMGLISFS